MLDSGYVLYLQRNGITDALLNEGAISFQTYLRGVQKYLYEHMSVETFGWDSTRRDARREALINEYITTTPKKVEGFFTGTVLHTSELLMAVRKEIIDEGILSDALQDSAINEIQVNHYDGAIFVEKAGHYVPYLDKNGKPYRFANNATFVSLISKMLDDGSGNTLRATNADALINSKTAKDYYRVSLVHDSVVTRDLPPYDQASMTLTLRKYKKDTLRLEDLVRGKTCTRNMAGFLSFVGMFDGKAMAVGPTASGKTTLLSILSRTIPPDVRVILCQNPTEILLTARDVNGRVLNNVVHWESKDLPKDQIKNTSPVMANLITHALRNSPQVILVGEIRDPEEFAQAFRAITTGHRLMGTFHAENASEAVERCVQELASAGGNQSDASLRKKVALGIDIIVSQKKLADGKRKIMAITELTGEVDSAGYPILNDLYKFVYSGATDFDEKGRVKLIHGKHVRMNKPTDRLLQKMYAAGITKEELIPFTRELDAVDDDSYDCTDGEFNLIEKRKLAAMSKTV